MFRDKFWLSLALTIPVLAWSPDLQMWLGYEAPAFPGSEWIPAIFGTAVFLYGGQVFLVGGLGELRARQPGMMTLISMAILVAFATSVAGSLGRFEVEETRQLLAATINRLPEREKLVLTLYYYEGLTLAEIGGVLGVTESRVCQIHTKAVLHLKSRVVAAERSAV